MVQYGHAHSILTVDDDGLMRRSLAFTLEQAGYDVKHGPFRRRSAGPGDRPSARSHACSTSACPAWMAWKCCASCSRRCDVPVIFLTARRRELEQVLGLELGADDYVTKPFDADVLLARIRAVLRRSQQADDICSRDTQATSWSSAICTIDVAAHGVLVAGKSSRSVAPRVRSAARDGIGGRQRACRPMNCWPASGVPNLWASPRCSTFTCGVCARNWKRLPNKPTRLVTVRSVGYRLVVHARRIGHG